MNSNKSLKFAMAVSAIALSSFVSAGVASAAPWICEKYYQCKDNSGTVLYPTAMGVSPNKAVAQRQARSSAARVKATRSYGCAADIKASTDAYGKTERCFIAPPDTN